MIGEGNEQFAFQQGQVYTEQDYFFTERRYEQLQNMKQQVRFALSEATYPSGSAKQEPQSEYPDDKKFGTVGAVALDQQGNLAAATSTGITNKRFVVWATRQSSKLKRWLKMAMFSFHAPEWASTSSVKRLQEILRRACVISKKMSISPVEPWCKVN